MKRPLTLTIDPDVAAKALDMSHLQPKKLVDRLGRLTTRWVRPPEPDVKVNGPIPVEVHADGITAEQAQIVATAAKGTPLQRFVDAFPTSVEIVDDITVMGMKANGRYLRHNQTIRLSRTLFERRKLDWAFGTGQDHIHNMSLGFNSLHPLVETREEFVRAITLHEIVHHLDEVGRMPGGLPSLRSEFLDAFRGHTGRRGGERILGMPITTYAASNVAEYMAETVTAYLVAPDLLRIRDPEGFEASQRALARIPDLTTAAKALGPIASNPDLVTKRLVDRLGRQTTRYVRPPDTATRTPPRRLARRQRVAKRNLTQAILREFELIDKAVDLHVARDNWEVDADEVTATYDALTEARRRSQAAEKHAHAVGVSRDAIRAVFEQADLHHLEQGSMAKAARGDVEDGGMKRYTLHLSRAGFARMAKAEGDIKNNPELRKKKIVDKRGRQTTRYVRNPAGERADQQGHLYDDDTTSPWESIFHEISELRRSDEWYDLERRALRVVQSAPWDYEHLLKPVTLYGEGGEVIEEDLDEDERMQVEIEALAQNPEEVFPDHPLSKRLKALRAQLGEAYRRMVAS